MHFRVGSIHHCRNLADRYNLRIGWMHVPDTWTRLIKYHVLWWLFRHFKADKASEATREDIHYYARSATAPCRIVFLDNQFSRASNKICHHCHLVCMKLWPPSKVEGPYKELPVWAPHGLQATSAACLPLVGPICDKIGSPYKQPACIPGPL
jgi:hypothetical protein